METIKGKNNSISPLVFGTAERGSTVSMNITNERLCPKNGTDVIITNTNNSNCLKNLSISEIVKIAETRTKIAGISRRSTDNPWRKRMAVSENITRREPTLNTPMKNQGVELTMAENELDNEFFENLLQKMTKEQFMPCPSGNDRLKKRMCLWDKENLITANSKKRRKEGRANAKLTPPKMEFFKNRLLPQQNDNSSLEGVKTRSGPQDQEISVPQNKFALDLIQDINMTEFSLRFTKSNPSSATVESVGGSLCGNQTVEDTISICTQETFELDNIDHDSVYEASPSHYYAGKYPKNFWDSSRLSTIEEDHEPPIVVKSSVLDAINMEFDAPLLTPPSSVEFTDCEACHSAQGKHGDNSNDNYSPFPSLAMIGNTDGENFEVSDKNLFT